MRQFSLQDLFPAYQPNELEPQYVGLLQLCAQINVPFPIERTKVRGHWWRMLHKIGHFAVKPDWYLQYARYLNDELIPTHGRAYFAGGTLNGLPNSITIPNIKVYEGSADTLPDVGLYKDPTLGGREAYMWALDVAQMTGWSVPGDASDADILHSRRHHRHNMAEWALDVPGGMLRPHDARNRPRFSLPYPYPATHAQLGANSVLIQAMGTRSATKKQRIEWEKWVAARWPEADLAERADNAKYKVPRTTPTARP